MTPPEAVSHPVEAPAALARSKPAARMDCGRRIASPPHHRGFSMVELLVVIAVSVVLTGMMFPALASVKENVRRVSCMSNLRTLGAATSLYTTNNKESLPLARSLKDKDNPRPQDLMLAHLGGEPENWNGLGWLYYAGYCGEPKCFYCPSHEGDHPYEKYKDAWRDVQNTQPIYMNYHYGGDRYWTYPFNPRSLDEGHRFILATDGVRTQSDVNHGTGLNLLLADGSVNWNEEVRGIFPSLPIDWAADDPKEQVEFLRVWTRIEHITQN